MGAVIIALLFFYFFNLYVGSIGISTTAVVGVAGLFYFLTDLENNLKLIANRKFIYLAAITGALLFFCLLSQIWNLDGYDFSMLVKVFKVPILFWGAYLILALSFKCMPNFGLTKLLELIVIVFGIQAVISLFMFFYFPAFELYLDILSVEKNLNFLERAHLIDNRLIGMGLAFFGAGVAYSVVLLILTYLRVSRDSVLFMDNFVFYSSLFLISLAGVMSARSFFLALIPCLSVLCWREFIINRDFVKNIISISLVGLLFGVISLAALSVLDSTRLFSMTEWAFELFFNIMEKKELHTSSTDKLLNMYIIPDNLLTLLFGDGRFRNPDASYYMNTDVGYFRLIYYFGTLGACIYFYLQYWLIFGASRSVFLARPSLKYLLVALYFAMLIFNLKGLVGLDSFSMLLFAYGLLASNFTNREEGDSFWT